MCPLLGRKLHGLYQPQRGLLALELYADEQTVCTRLAAGSRPWVRSERLSNGVSLCD